MKKIEITLADATITVDREHALITLAHDNPLPANKTLHQCVIGALEVASYMLLDAASDVHAAHYDVSKDDAFLMKIEEMLDVGESSESQSEPREWTIQEEQHVE